jgi:hypothetical protein
MLAVMCARAKGMNLRVAGQLKHAEEKTVPAKAQRKHSRSTITQHLCAFAPLREILFLMLDDT